jgi:hypothetical protein
LSLFCSCYCRPSPVSPVLWNPGLHIFVAPYHTTEKLGPLLFQNSLIPDRWRLSLVDCTTTNFPSYRVRTFAQLTHGASTNQCFLFHVIYVSLIKSIEKLVINK